MKRNCPNCNSKGLRWTFHGDNTIMRCENCDAIFEYSGWLYLIWLIPFIFFINLIKENFLLALILALTLSFLIHQYGSIKRVGPIKYIGIEGYEPTDDVTENIRRYKEAQRKAAIAKRQK